MTKVRLEREGQYQQEKLLYCLSIVSLSPAVIMNCEQLLLLMLVSHWLQIVLLLLA